MYKNEIIKNELIKKRIKNKLMKITDPSHMTISFSTTSWKFS